MKPLISSFTQKFWWTQNCETRDTASQRNNSVGGHRLLAQKVTCHLSAPLHAAQSTLDTHSIESVIINEGFGNLDQKGRREIIDELHHLKNVMRRIILVPYQEEFVDAFPNCYQIELKDGTSAAHIVQEG